MSKDARSELAPTGVLRAGINMGNFLLVTGRTPDGDPDGVSPDMAREIARRLGVPLKLIPYKTPGELGDDA
ncbi:MAG: ABC transporter substrate-binding protein, partial [Alphaproteobacteria bacterium]